VQRSRLQKEPGKIDRPASEPDTTHQQVPPSPVFGGGALLQHHGSRKAEGRGKRGENEHSVRKLTVPWWTAQR